MTKLDRRATIWAAGCAFLAYAGASILFSSIEYDKAWAGAQLATLALAFLLGTRVPANWLWLGVTALTGANVLVAGADWSLGWNSGFEGYQGFMGNPNIFGCFLVISIAAALSFHWWWFLPFGALGFLEIRSRGSVLALGLVLLVWLWRSYRTLAIVALCVAIVAIGELSLRGSGREIGILARLGVWQDTLNHLTLWGSGFGSFFEAYNTWPVHTNMTLIRPTHAYNDFLEIIFELGLGAIFLWLFLALVFDRGVTLIHWAFLALTLTYFPLSLPILGHLFAFSVGSTLKEQHYGSMETEYPALSQSSRS